LRGPAPVRPASTAVKRLDPLGRDFPARIGGQDLSGVIDHHQLGNAGDAEFLLEQIDAFVAEGNRNPGHVVVLHVFVHGPFVLVAGHQHDFERFVVGLELVVDLDEFRSEGAAGRAPRSRKIDADFLAGQFAGGHAPALDAFQAAAEQFLQDGGGRGLGCRRPGARRDRRPAGPVASDKNLVGAAELVQADLDQFARRRTQNDLVALDVRQRGLQRLAAGAGPGADFLRTGQRQAQKQYQQDKDIWLHGRLPV